MATTWQQVRVEVGRPPKDDGETAQWEQWIKDARLLLSSGDGVHEGLGALDALDQDTVDYVVRMAVAAHVRRPDNATQVQVQVDGDSVSRTYSSGKGRVAIDPDWWAMLTPSTDHGGAFSVRPAFEPDPPGRDRFACWRP